MCCLGPLVVMVVIAIGVLGLGARFGFLGVLARLSTPGALIPLAIVFVALAVAAAIQVRRESRKAPPEEGHGGLVGLISSLGRSAKGGAVGTASGAEHAVGGVMKAIGSGVSGAAEAAGHGVTVGASEAAKGTASAATAAGRAVQKGAHVTARTVGRTARGFVRHLPFVPHGESRDAGEQRPGAGP